MTAPQLPTPSADALLISHTLVDRIRQRLDASNGWISFTDYMQQALYAPGLGYYAGGATKFGDAGDFTTAPEMSPLFGACVAGTAAHALRHIAQGRVMEFGAGTGVLAAEILTELERLDCLPTSYDIVDLSPDLKQRQLTTLQTRVPHLLDRVRWLDALPEHFDGFIVGNEVLDAMPCALVYRDESGQLFERGVVWREQGLAYEDQPLQSGQLFDLASALDLPCDYLTEIQPQMHAFVRSVAQSLRQGALLLIDYGFAAREYYHPQRNQGTLMAHYRHHSLIDPFYLPGLCDITCHVDFSAVYSHAEASGLQLEGYIPQAQYLLNTGLTQKLEALGIDNTRQYVSAAASVHKLTSPAEMGELFKAIAFSRGLNLDTLLHGFEDGDDSWKL
ncbi:SAM-dependent methyltransferase [Silvimonas sp. JCM 19000]